MSDPLWIKTSIMSAGGLPWLERPGSTTLLVVCSNGVSRKTFDRFDLHAVVDTDGAVVTVGHHTHRINRN